MKITGTRSYIKVEIEGKVVEIKGELLVRSFIAYSKNKYNIDTSMYVPRKHCG